MYAFLRNKKLRLAAGFVLGLVLIAIIYALRTIFIPFFVSLIIAYMLNPVVNALQRRGVGRTLSVVFIFVLLCGVFVVTVTLAAPAAFRQAKDLITAVAGDEFYDVNGNGIYDEGIDRILLDRNKDGTYTKPLLETFNTWFMTTMTKMSESFANSPRIQKSIRKMLAGVEEYYKTATDQMMENAGEYVKAFLRNTLAILSWIMGLLLVPIYLFFLLKEMENIKRGIVPLLPGRSREDIIRIAKKIDRAMAAFFRGRIIVCTICSIFTWIGLWIIGVKYSFLFGVLIGSATVIPFLGLVFLAPTLLVAYFGEGGGLSPVIWTGVLYAAVQTLQGSILDPIILGREVHIHPLVLILMFLICAKLMGFIGLLLAVPIASILKILAEEFILPPVKELAAEEKTRVMKKEFSRGEDDVRGDGPGGVPPAADAGTDG